MQEHEDQDSDVSLVSPATIEGSDVSIGRESRLVDFPLSHTQVVADQAEDSEVCQLAQGVLNEEEADLHAQCFYVKSGILMRKWCPHDVSANEE